MKVSVALCTFNGERFLQQQLESILHQERPVDEIVVCDDCSTDNTLALLEVYAAQEPKITLVRNPTNLGYRKNFEKALRLATGDWVFLSDHDDVWMPQKVARYIQAIERRTSGVGLVFGNACLIDAGGKPLGLDLYRLIMAKKFNDVDQAIPSERALPLLYSGNFVTGATAAVHRSLIASAAPFPPLMVHDNWLAWVTALLSQEMIYVSECLTLYRKHDGQTVSVEVIPGQPSRFRMTGTVDSSIFHADRYLTKHFASLGLQLSMAAQRCLRKLARRMEAHYHLKLRERILKLPRRVRAPWIWQYLITGRYRSWETHHPKAFFEIAHALYDSWRP